MEINRKDVIWNYVATFLKIGVSVLLLPFILRVFPQETIAIWTVFSTIIALTSLLDFGFNPSFARNVSYVVSGVKELKTTGYQVVENANANIDYGLFKGLINTMRWFYARMALLLFILLATAGTYYIHTILHSYSGNKQEVYIAWVILVFINSYSLYTYYYDSLLQGKGLIKRAKQIEFTGNIIYLCVAIVLIMLRFNLIAVVSAQALSILIRRILSYYTVYTSDFKRALKKATARAIKEFIKPILPNAVKLGLTGLGSFLVTRSSVLIGSLFLSLDDIASYGITIQIIAIISSVAGVYFATYQPKIAQYRIQNNILAIKKLYLRSCGLMLLIFIVCGLALLFFGDWTMEVIKSKTPLMSQAFIFVALLVNLLLTNHSTAAGFLVTKNDVPFFYAALIEGVVSVILLIIFLKFTNLGVWALILSQGITWVCYSNWKWPLVVIKELFVTDKGLKGTII